MAFTADRPWLRLVIDHNPFYLLSGAFMLLGCYAISVDTHGQPDALMPLLRLMGVFLAYQAAVLGLGSWLARLASPQMQRDAAHLLVVWAVLTLDATLLYHELFTRSLTAGTALACVGVTWSLAGLAAIGRVVRLRLSSVAWALIAADVVLIHVVPGWYRWFAASGFLPPLTEFRAAWLLGLWIAAHALAPDWSRPRKSSRAGHVAILHRLLLILPGVSVLAHVYVANWTYSRHGSEAFDAHHLVPLLLGVAAVVARAGWREEQRRLARAAAVGMGGAAVALSLVTVPRHMSLYWPWMDAMAIHIPGLAVTGFAALLLWTWLHHRGGPTLACGYLTAATAFWLHTPPFIARAGRAAITWLRNLMPDDGADWGVLAIAAAFVTLAIGAAVSLWPQSRNPSPARKL